VIPPTNAPTRLCTLTLLLGLLATLGALGPPPAAAAALDGGHDELVLRVGEPFLGDLPELREKRFVRALVSYSKTSFFVDRGQPRGFEHSLLLEYEKYLNTNARTTFDRVRVVFVPTPFDQLLQALREGRGDIVAAGLTITPERQELAAFTDPYLPGVEEVVVLHRGVTGLASLDDLAGRSVYVRPGSSYVAHLQALSRSLKQRGLSPIEIVEGDPDLTTEDILEMVNAGIFELTVADDHIADAWAQVLPDLEVRHDLAVHQGGRIAWAVRAQSTELRADLNAFLRSHRKGTLLGNIYFKRYYSGSKWIRNAAAPEERAKLDSKIALFKKYGELFGFDWLALGAQAYQESGLDNSKRSRAGAVGIMQVKPSTAADSNVNVPDVHLLENNIHAGAKYLSFIRSRYFSSPDISPEARMDLSWAAYNAGPARINKLRRHAEQRGFDPNRWFGNVEKMAAESIGRETVDYVANINKYYVTYRMLYDEGRTQMQERARAATGD